MSHQTIPVNDFIQGFTTLLNAHQHMEAWEITSGLANIIETMIPALDGDYIVNDKIAIHKTASIEPNVTIKSPAIIGPHCFIGANAYLRGGVLLDQSVHIGPGCEIKQSIIFSGTAAAHFNYIGNSIVGHNVNLEAGSVVANHYNERSDKRIYVFYNLKTIDTQTEKFGSLIGDHVKIGANAVLSPGTILTPGTVVGRLELVDQSKP